MLKFTIDQKLSRFEKEIVYTWNLVNSLSLFKQAPQSHPSPAHSKPFWIYYGDAPPSECPFPDLWIWASPFFYETYLNSDRLPESIYFTDKIISFFPKGDITDHNYIHQMNHGLFLRLDILATTFILSSLYEEYLPHATDEHGRFDLSTTLAEKFGFKFRAVIHEYSKLLLQITQPERPYQGPKNLTVCLGMDIDHRDANFSIRNYCSPRKALKFGFRHQEPSIFLQQIKEWFLRNKPQPESLCHPKNSAIFLTNLGIEATFFFIARPTQGIDNDAPYSVLDGDIRASAKHIHDEGHEIALHGSYHSLTDPSSINQEVKELQNSWQIPIHGGRQHYLRWNPSFWEYYQQAGLQYDSSVSCYLGFGIRNGLVSPYQPFDINKRKKLSIYEYPILISDQFIKGYPPLEVVEPFLQDARNLINTVREAEGCLSTMWHNTSFSYMINPFGMKAFQQLFDPSQMKFMTFGNHLRSLPNDQAPRHSAFS